MRNVNMCLYPVSEAPYLALGTVSKVTNDHYYVEDTKGHTKRVRPIYVGPFDGEIVLKFGALVSRYIAGVSDLQHEFNTKNVEMFNAAAEMKAFV